MESSWTKTRNSFKSPLRVVVTFLLRSRDKKANKCGELKRRLQESQRLLAERQAELERQREETRRWQQKAQRLESDMWSIQRPALLLPADPPLGKHGFGARMVCIPHPTTIRNWLLRAGVAAMHEPLERSEDCFWMVDHSNQIGPEKALVVVAVPASKMPPPEKTLRHEDLRVLTVRPGTSWTREDVVALTIGLENKRTDPPPLCRRQIGCKSSLITAFPARIVFRHGFWHAPCIKGRIEQEGGQNEQRSVKPC